MALLFLSSGWSALADILGTAAYFEGLGFPLPTLVAWAVGLFEVIAGFLVLIGLKMRIAAALLAAFSLAAGFVGHYGQGGGDPTLAFMHSQALMKDIAIAGGFMALAIAGPGNWSVDGWRR
jgi:putative oxidoreductase